MEGTENFDGSLRASMYVEPHDLSYEDEASLDNYEMGERFIGNNG